MTSQELQEEELEVLQSIYDGDENYKQISSTVFQYKIGEDGHFKSFLLEISWPQDYPDVLPEIGLSAFYNKHVLPAVKEEIVKKVKEEGENWIGSAATFTLFEWAKENAEDLMVNQTIIVQAQKEEKTEAAHEQAKIKVRKEHLTKSQKRKMVDRTDQHGERPRGWDWVDIVKHLSQGGKQTRDDS
eukprot:GHVU01203702.1.p1 GENE.GHVU01203702.1~~GHVU01203702.1.p1  ORF type:complete len:186 (+),score=38.88 GHVU01203702.1:257-814(+)